MDEPSTNSESKKKKEASQRSRRHHRFDVLLSILIVLCGAGTWDLAVAASERFAAIAPLAGGGNARAPHV